MDFLFSLTISIKNWATGKAHKVRHYNKTACFLYIVVVRYLAMAKKKLKLYVWEGVLTDYTDGCMFALAENAEDARNLIEEKMGYRTGDLAIEPKEITEREGFYVWGGG